MVEKLRCKEIFAAHLSIVESDPDWISLKRDALAGKESAFGQRASALMNAVVAGEPSCCAMVGVGARSACSEIRADYVLLAGGKFSLLTCLCWHSTRDSACRHCAV